MNKKEKPVVLPKPDEKSLGFCDVIKYHGSASETGVTRFYGGD